MIVIPDIHGRDFWKEPVRMHTEEGIVFLGDYVDPYPEEGLFPYTALRTLCKVIELKEKNPDRIVLLLGNHDLSYLSQLVPKCRYDYEYHDEIKGFLKRNLAFFDIAYEKRIGNRHFVFSHAGILREWIQENEILYTAIRNGEKIEIMNQLFHQGLLYQALGNVSSYRGGRSEAGSCVWADVEEHQNARVRFMPECYQVFGHTLQASGNPIISEDFACLDCQKAFRIDCVGEIKVLNCQ